MYGVPNNLPIERFLGDALFQVGIGVDGVHFIFGKAGTISVSGRWELHDKGGKLIDYAQKNNERQSYQIHVILNEEVSGHAIDAPRSFSLIFASGHRLTVYDDTPQYESFAIEPGGIVV